MKVTNQVRNQLMIFSFILIATACSEKKTNSINYEAPPTEDETATEQENESEELTADKSKPKIDEQTKKEDAKEVTAARDQAYSDDDDSISEENEQIKKAVQEDEPSNDYVFVEEEEVISMELQDKLNSKEIDADNIEMKIDDPVEKHFEVKNETEKFIVEYLDMGTVDTKEGIYRRDIIVAKLMEQYKKDSETFYSVVENFPNFSFEELKNELQISQLRMKVENFIKREEKADVSEKDEGLESIIQDIDKDITSARYVLHDLQTLHYNAVFYLALEISAYSKFHDVAIKDAKEVFKTLSVEQVNDIGKRIGHFMNSDFRNDLFISLLKRNKDQHIGNFVEAYHQTYFNHSYEGFEKDLSDFTDNEVMKSVVKHTLTKLINKESVSSKELSNAFFIVSSQIENYKDLQELEPALISYIVTDREEFSPLIVQNIRKAAKALVQTQNGRVLLESRLKNTIKTSHDARLAIDILDGALYDKDLKNSLGQELIEDIIANIATDVLGLKTLNIQETTQHSISEDFNQLKVVWINGLSKPEILRKLKRFDKFLIDS